MTVRTILAVDLDGTAVLTDTFHESLLALLRRNPVYLFLLPLWLFSGIAFLKARVAEKGFLDVTLLPYNIPFIQWLRVEKANGRWIVLCTAANERIANAVSQHLDLFDDVIASDAITNLKGANKLNVLQKRYGEKGFVYAGNSNADIEVWAGSSQAIVVNASNAVAEKASQVSSVFKCFPATGTDITDWIGAVRLHQWLKNLLLFVALLAAHELGDIQRLSSVTLAFISFGLCASSIYIINDLLDLESDRVHPRKRHRAFASAKVSISLGLVIALLLLGTSCVLGVVVGHEFLIVLLLYFALTVIYSLVLKRFVIVDVLALASLYTVRVVGGAAAAQLPLSFWLLAFSIFLFLSLALVKRYAELLIQMNAGNRKAHGRGYMVSDAPLLQTFGVSSGYISALIIALYVRSEDVVPLYANPSAILLLLPMLLYWVSWVWLKAARGEMHDDPIIFAARDKSSLIVAALMALVFIYAAIGL